ncbi:hypothetical protein Bcep1808_7620 (plasmid) [Burkholderia vietnamiensis G4]|uniref:Uncharacterized protein n=1 Tax=Burkholderia vietnamiensis (strain G4 / LMG 22486) TaxID=269482 RepID=A4JW38_BURVG|nr:hypothetical protein Bcep1808_7620 [Burkholderia vietnamiensis G4]
MIAAIFITIKPMIGICAYLVHPPEGFPCQPRKYLEEGSDHIRFGFEHGGVYVTALYNTVSGRAFGEYELPRRKRKLDEKGIEFSTDDKLDGTPWFDALLSFLYVA